MGCGPSILSNKCTETHLIATKLSFTSLQLENLNGFFRKMIENDVADKDIRLIETTVERLVQRLVIGVGNLDRRFASMFLISLNEKQRIKQLKFEYLLRIDALSTPLVDSSKDTTIASVEEEAALPGFARLRIRGADVESWAEFLGPGGRLRRDLVKAKLVNLLAAATKQDAINDVEEHTYQTPGQVIDAETLDKILKQPEHCRIFYGPAAAEKDLPQPRDHRIALVEDASGILLKISLAGNNTKDIEVRLLVGAGVSSWSSLADYPRRIPLHHCDALLHYTAAQSGMYAVAVGPYPGARCDDRATLWRLRVPATEKIMNQHYSEESVPVLTESVLMYILDQLRGRLPLNIPMHQKQDYLRAVSRHIIRTTHWWLLERAGPDPLRNWAPDSLSRHVLVALDELVTALRCQNLSCYFHSRCNIMLQCAKGGILHHEDSYVSDARLLESYLHGLHKYSLNLTPVDLPPSDVLENELIVRWRRVMTSLPRGSMEGCNGYNSRQLTYLGLIVGEVLKVKELLLHGYINDCTFLGFPVSGHNPSSLVENLIYLLTLVLKQARDQIYIITNHQRTRSRCQRSASVPRRRNKAAGYFERSVDILVDAVRRDRETAYADLENDTVMAKSLLRWLYFGMEHDKKILGHILRPYLGNLFNSSHENAWHVESWRKRQDIYNSEMRSISLFCKLVTTQEVSPANGIVEALSKGWSWAEETIKIIERSEDGLRLVFIMPGRIMRYSLTFTNNRGLSAFSTWSKVRNIGNAARRATIARNSMITATDSLPKVTDRAEENQINTGYASHIDLRDSSPLTYIVSLNRRKGRQRGPGGLIPALVALNKFRILQEAAAVLPHEERIAMLDIVQKVSREASRRLRRFSCSDLDSSNTPKQTYTPRSEAEFIESSEDRLSPSSRQRGIIAEYQKQLHQEILEMHDTLTRGLRPRNCIPSWDSTSTLSWTSSIRSVGSRLRRKRSPIWNTMRGSSFPMWDRVSTDGNFTKSKSAEMISREESPKWSNSDSRQSGSEIGLNEDEILPSWEFLETALNRKLQYYDHEEADNFLELKNNFSINLLQKFD